MHGSVLRRCGIPVCAVAHNGRPHRHTPNDHAVVVMSCVRRRTDRTAYAAQCPMRGAVAWHSTRQKRIPKQE